MIASRKRSAFVKQSRVSSRLRRGGGLNSRALRKVPHWETALRGRFAAGELTPQKLELAHRRRAHEEHK